MSLAQPSLQDRRPSPNLALNLASNNPFRQRATSPGDAPSTSPNRLISNENDNPRNVSTNPFLDNYQPAPEFALPPKRDRSPQKPVPRVPVNNREAAVHAHNAADLLTGLTLQEQPVSDRNIQAPMPAPRGDTLDTSIYRNRRSEDEERRARRSQDEQRRMRREIRDPAKINGGEVNRSPEKRDVRRPLQRRNSDTSILDVKDEERRNKNGGRRDRDGAKLKETRSRDARSGKSTKSSRRVDLIDKLDVTGIYGPGMFHHDGPFDACNPHRNRRGARAAPMRAFAEGSANNALGGSGPVNKEIDFDQFHGRGAQGYSDYNASSFAANPADPYSGFRRAPGEAGRRGGVPDPGIVDPKARTQFVVGNESAGLGTSTFLEGTPVSRATLQRRESENDTVPGAGAGAGAGGLQRKKSLVQKIRGISKPRPGENRVASPESQQMMDPLSGAVFANTTPSTVQSAGGRSGMHEKNPFFSDPVDAKEPATTAATKIPNPDSEAFVSVTRARTASSPNRGIGRRGTNENVPTEPFDGKSIGGGLLSRVKSLKGGRRTRPDRSGSASQGTGV